jgi:hypothetical protein
VCVYSDLGYALTILLTGSVYALYDSAYIINADNSRPDDRYVLLAQIINNVNRTLFTFMLVRPTSFVSLGHVCLL